MKILIHIPWGVNQFSIGGTERFVIDLARGIKETGEGAFIVCSNLSKMQIIEGIPVFGVIPDLYREKIKKYGYANEEFFKKEIIGDKVTDLSLKKFSDYVSFQIKQFDFDLLHLNGFFYSAFLNEDVCGKNIIVTNHENDKEMDNYWGEGAFQAFLDSGQKGLRLSNHLVCPSKYYSNFFAKKINLPVNNIRLGIDLHKFNLEEFEKRKLSVKKKKFTFLIPSRFEIKQKGHDIAIETLGKLKKIGYDFNLIISGLDEDVYSRNIQILTKIIKENNLEENVLIQRFNNILDAYAQADVVISPERFCSYGLAVSESLSLGIPTFMAPIPTYLEIGFGYKHAMFPDKNEPEYFTKKIIEFLSEKRNFSSDTKKFRDQNSFEKCSGQYISLYEGLLKAKRKEILIPQGHF